MTSQVALVTMPFQPLRSPPLSTGLLKAELAQAGITADNHYLGLLFASMVGRAVYDRVVELPQSLQAGEWVFAAALTPRDPTEDEAYLSTVIDAKPTDRLPNGREATSGIIRADLVFLRTQVDPFLERCLAVTDWSRYRLIGFSSNFQQHAVALAFSRLLKQRFPHLFIAFGGSNCEAEMGAATFRSFPWVDSVCTGEGDEVFPRLAARVLSDGEAEPLPGVWQRGMPVPPPPQRVENMDHLPIPDFGEFFTQLDHADLGPGYLELPFQATRGCWWGEKNHCTFCGFNGQGMAMHQKSPERVAEELCALIKRYGQHTRHLAGADNIVPMGYFGTLFPLLAERRHGGMLFFEIKANLRKEHVEAMARGGVHAVQPGIESLSSPVLRLMRKGATMLQNVQILKWCAEFGITVWWSYLVGFPGETDDHYTDQPEIMRLLAHLPPPAAHGIHKVRFDRFSPYVSNPAAFGIRNMQPVPAYRFVYPGVDAAAASDLAYFFSGDYDGAEQVSKRIAILDSALGEWESGQFSAALFSVSIPEALIIGDFRPMATQLVFFLTGATRSLYEACDSIRSVHALEALPELKGEPVRQILDTMIADRLLLHENDAYLALAIPIGNGYHPPTTAWGKFLATCGGLIQGSAR